MKKKPYKSTPYATAKEAKVIAERLRKSGNFAWTEAKYGENIEGGVTRLRLVGHYVYWITPEMMHGALAFASSV